MKPERYEFPPFVADAHDGSLRRDTQAIELRPKTFAVLCYLLERPGQLVSKDELLKNVWAGTHVADSALTVCMAELRRALGDDPKKPQYIATVTKRGYRFIAAVTTAATVLSDQSSAFSFPPPSAFSSQLTTDNRQLTTALVGRDSELTVLHNLFAKSCAGQRQVVFVTGEPGIGKTTLVDAFLQSLASTAQGQADEQQRAGSTEQGTKRGTAFPALSSALLAPCYARGQCIEHFGAGEAYLPILDALGQRCRTAGGEQLIEILRRHAPTWLVQMPELLPPADLEALQQRVAGATRERMLREITGALEAVTTSQPLILVLEDLHWSDYATLDFLSFVARRQGPARLMIIGTYRPGDVLRQEHPLRAVKQELSLHRHCEEVSLPYLTPAQVEEYLARRFSAGSLPARIGTLIHQRTEGNPLFIETITNEFIKQEVITQRGEHWELVGNVESSTIPVRLWQFIEQQIGRLATEERSVLETASVVGMEFPSAIIAAALEKEFADVDKQCEALAQRRQFVQAHGISTWPDGTIATRYSFLHTLYQEVLAQRLSPMQRLQLHRRIGERLEQAYSNKTQEVATVLAYHFEQGRDPQRARQYYEQAARHAQQRAAYREVTHHFLRALAMLQLLPENTARDQDELMLQVSLAAPLLQTKGYAAPEVEHCFKRIRELCQQLGDQPQLVVALTGLFRFHLFRTELDLAEDISGSLVQQVQQFGLPFLTQASVLPSAIVSLMRGHYPTAYQQLASCFSLMDNEEHRHFTSLHGDDPVGVSLGYAALALWRLGYAEQAVTTIQKALRWTEELNRPHSMAVVCGQALPVYKSLHDSEMMQTCVHALFKIAADYDLHVWTALGTVMQGWLAVQQGQREGIEQMQQGLALYKKFGIKVLEPEALAMLVEAYRDTGQLEEGLQTLALALEHVERSGQRGLEAEFHRLAGELMLQEANQKSQGKSQKEARDSRRETSPSSPRVSSLKSLAPSGGEDEVEGCFRKAIAVAQQQQAKSFELRAVMSLVRLRQQQVLQAETRNTQHVTRTTQHAARSLLAEAHSMLSELYAWFTEGFATKDLQEAKALLDTLEQQTGTAAVPLTRTEPETPSPALRLVVNKQGRR